jgi:endothelin-converting enzyme
LFCVTANVPQEYYEEEDISEVYRKALEQLLFIIFDEKPSSQFSLRWPPIPWPPWGDDDDGKAENSTVRAKRLSKEVLKFEKKIARASQDLWAISSHFWMIIWLAFRDELFDPIGSYNPMPFSNLTAGLPEFNFPNYLATFAPRAFPTRVIVTYPPYVSSLSHILESAESEVVEAYLIARIALSVSPLLGQETDAWKVVRELNEILGGLKKGAVPDRAEYCAKQVSDTMGYVFLDLSLISTDKSVIGMPRAGFLCRRHSEETRRRRLAN